MRASFGPLFLHCWHIRYCLSLVVFVFVFVVIVVVVVVAVVVVDDDDVAVVVAVDFATSSLSMTCCYLLVTAYIAIDVSFISMHSRAATIVTVYIPSTSRI